jgi:AcrR family transcriptional regulator
VTRADVTRNRQRCLDAARTLFAESGLDVTFDDVAAKAGLGVATLYRHFPNRDELLDTVLLERTREAVDHAAHAAGIVDAAEGLAYLVRTLARMFAEDRLLLQLGLERMADPSIDHPEIQTMIELHRQVFDRARRAGVIRRDVRHTDLPALLAFTIVRRPAPAPRRRRAAWEVYTEVVLDGLRSTTP